MFSGEKEVSRSHTKWSSDSKSGTPFVDIKTCRTVIRNYYLALRPTKKCGQNANVRSIYRTANCAADGLRSYSSPDDSQWQAMYCRGRSRVCLQDRNDDGHAPKRSQDIVASCRTALQRPQPDISPRSQRRRHALEPSQDIVASCRSFRGSPPKILITSPSSICKTKFLLLPLPIQLPWQCVQ